MADCAGVVGGAGAAGWVAPGVEAVVVTVVGEGEGDGDGDGDALGAGEGEAPGGDVLAAGEEAGAGLVGGTAGCPAAQPEVMSISARTAL